MVRNEVMAEFRRVRGLVEFASVVGCEVFLQIHQLEKNLYSLGLFLSIISISSKFALQVDMRTYAKKPI